MLKNSTFAALALVCVAALLAIGCGDTSAPPDIANTLPASTSTPQGSTSTPAASPSPSPVGATATPDFLNPLPPPTGAVAVLVAKLRSANRQVAFDAATELGNMEPKAVAAIPALVDLATFDEAGAHAVHPTLAAGEALPKISAQLAVPHLIEAVKQPHKRYWAAKILGGFGEAARPAIPALVDALRAVATAQTGNEYDACVPAGFALAAIPPDGLSALIHEMGHRNVEVRKLAIQCVPEGSGGKPAVQELERRLSDSEPEVRAMAAGKLARIGPDAKDAIGFLERAIRRETGGSALSSMRMALESIQRTEDE